MPATTAQKEALASNPIWPCDIWEIIAADGTAARYASHSRNVTYNGNVYSATPNEPSTSVMQIGLESDTAELVGIFDDVITKASIEAGRWKRAAIIKQILIDYRDPAVGVVRVQKGFVGKVEPMGAYAFKLEFRSITDLLKQKIGDLTSNSDRLRTLAELGINVAAFTHSTTVSSVTDRRKFRINYVQPSDDYFVNGKVVWTSGDNDGLEMEIKSSAVVSGKTELELHLPMPSTIDTGDELDAVRGYRLTREDCKLLGATAVLNSQAEWDLPSMGFVLRYPE